MRIKTAQIVGNEAIYKIGNQLEVEQLKTMYGDDVGKIEIGIEYIDPRQFSIKQRKLFFSLLNDIYKYTGQGVKELEEYFYQEYYSATFGGVVDLHNSSGTTLYLNGIFQSMRQQIYYQKTKHISYMVAVNIENVWSAD